MAETIYRFFQIPGKPVPAARMTQGTKRNQRSRRYLAYKSTIGQHYNIAHPGAPWLDGPIKLRVEVFLARPSSRRWDSSNVLKAIEDGLNEIAYKDDKAITDTHLVVKQSPGGEDAVNVYLWGQEPANPNARWEIQP